MHSNTSHVIVYRVWRIWSIWFNTIQIHLMLLFITDVPLAGFRKGLIQIHLMLLFIQRRAGKSQRPGNIQIHLMLLFIISECRHRLGNLLFKYISCYCLSQPSDIRKSISKIQIHLMLLFISNRLHKQIYIIIFKYISCYCLSANIENCSFCTNYSNTSHVIVYRLCFWRLVCTT